MFDAAAAGRWRHHESEFFGVRYAIGMLQFFARRVAISIAWSGEARRRLSWMQWARRALIFVGTMLAIPQLQKGFHFGIHEAWLPLFPSHVLVQV